MNLLDGLFSQYGETITLDEIAELLSVGKPAVYRMLQRGDLPAYKLPGGGWVIVTAELKAHLLAHRNSYKDNSDADISND